MELTNALIGAAVAILVAAIPYIYKWLQLRHKERVQKKEQAALDVRKREVAAEQEKVEQARKLHEARERQIEQERLTQQAIAASALTSTASELVRSVRDEMAELRRANAEEVEKLHQQYSAELGGLKERLAVMESLRNADLMTIARLQSELDDLRKRNADLETALAVSNAQIEVLKQARKDA